ncbi:uncharacterized protein J4E79_004225 [Alternaria viburni]|uniref:uncharacterized protein n=1 Tax=Alternaria viburni TaxID=566460 RepID=UPI0020C4BCB6|nr:uncharacterized protein J4E79_004225 [Alternaria viburni]KAI4662914.1 hypothetical protein J4E79_004225 [Alternaria viburni]
MPSTPTFGQTRNGCLDRAVSDDHPVASGAGLRLGNGTQYPYTLVGSHTLVEDARAVWNGDADHLLGNNEQLADIDGIHGIDQDLVNAVASYVLGMSVALRTNSGNTIPYVSLHQLRIQAPVSPVIPPVNNQVQHGNVTASRQCPYGCPNTFGRPGEYRRHMKKHNGPFFPCTRPHCGRMFYRQDKLSDHLNKGH